jgi:hypothetical protein
VQPFFSPINNPLVSKAQIMLQIDVATLVSLHHPKGGDAIQYKKRCFAEFCIGASIRIDASDSN